MNRLIIILVFIQIATVLFSAAGDTLIVQTITFDDIEKRQGVYEFPDDERTWEKIWMYRTLKCDERTKQDSFACGEWDYCTYTLIHKPVGDTVEVFELDNYVTPYGIRLDLNGECGWTYIYDVTDYAPLLRGKVDLSSGSQSELLDLKFIFVEGTPPRDVISVKNIYKWGNYKYELIAEDSIFKETEIVLDPQAYGYKLRARISGHGHEGPRNCCEWDRKTNTYLVNGYVLARWIVWKNCGDNAVYPQGGTWQFDRAGWCPGTSVDTYDFEITDQFEPGDTLHLDYNIEMYRDNGEKNGYFRQTHQLFTYGPPNFEINPEVYDIIAPSDKDAYSRVNPIIKDPKIVIRNSGSQTLRTLMIDYGLKGEEAYKYTWNGVLEFTEKDTLILPNIDWLDYTDLNFFAECSLPNGVEDEYAYNNYLSSKVVAPEIIPGKFYLHIKAQGLGRAKQNAFYITNDAGGVLYQKETFEDNEDFMQLIELENGLYELRIIDRAEDGMIRHWWNYSTNPELMGENGKIELLDLEKEPLKVLKYDFAEEEVFRFRVE
ncbi:MAG: peptide-N-glycosidase F-related protein [Candidatus Stygibacter frigidus]|nr:peptide-N-glycosidase F-related protein [Candidatus Stygibacter frigidus]